MVSVGVFVSRWAPDGAVGTTSVRGISGVLIAAVGVIGVMIEVVEVLVEVVAMSGTCSVVGAMVLLGVRNIGA